MATRIPADMLPTEGTIDRGGVHGGLPLSPFVPQQRSSVPVEQIPPAHREPVEEPGHDLLPGIEKVLSQSRLDSIADIVKLLVFGEMRQLVKELKSVGQLTEETIWEWAVLRSNGGFDNDGNKINEDNNSPNKNGDPGKSTKGSSKRSNGIKIVEPDKSPNPPNTPVSETNESGSNPAQA